MAGQIKYMIDKIIDQKAQGDEAWMYLMQAKLALKGINTRRYDSHSKDDPIVLEKLRQAAKDFGVTLS